MFSITPRSAWTPAPVPNPTPARNVPFGFLHHEGGGVRGVPADKGAVLRAIEATVKAKNYTAIDYNLMVFNDGDVWEGRGEAKEDAATLHHNADGFSVCAVGNYQVEAASDALVAGIANAFRDAMSNGWLAGGASIQGHRDVFGTACPGNNLYARLDDIRRLIFNTPALPVEDESIMGQPNRFITATTASPWYFYNGSSITPVDRARADLLLDLGLVKRGDPQVAVVGQPMIDTLLQVTR